MVFVTSSQHRPIRLLLTFDIKKTSFVVGHRHQWHQVHLDSIFSKGLLIC
jgi:hypothetical protein